MRIHLAIVGALIAITAAEAAAAQAEPRAYTDMPRVRIRELPRGGELTPLAFGQWLRSRPAEMLDLIGAPELASIKDDATLLKRTVPYFRQADRNDNGRLVAEEVAELFLDAQRTQDVVDTSVGQKVAHSDRRGLAK
ncbi:hypothetical protein [Sphingomonas crocodyli]|uniref:EF-hand domain-containing protein n=1 Tax=Sphingomonas crocodyli TaxID=1979270 RepID=A0A437LXT4_9SPHN|nr:hypothetical protein [Sphingomonas crocodyli]RVT90146.1 hypothetical protein EOD43_17720 [Sphingomonas crocodyli]